MSSTSKPQPDPAAIDASISVLGDEAGEPKVASIDPGAGAQSRAAVDQAGSGRPTEGAQEDLAAPIAEDDGSARAGEDSVERPGNDPDPV